MSSKMVSMSLSDRSLIEMTWRVAGFAFCVMGPPSSPLPCTRMQRARAQAGCAGSARVRLSRRLSLKRHL